MENTILQHKRCMIVNEWWKWVYILNKFKDYDVYNNSIVFFFRKLRLFIVNDQMKITDWFNLRVSQLLKNYWCLLRMNLTRQWDNKLNFRSRSNYVFKVLYCYYSYFMFNLFSLLTMFIDKSDLIIFFLNNLLLI